MVLARDRRQFLRFLGAGFTGAAGAHMLGPLLETRGPRPFQQAAGGFSFTAI